MLFNQDITVFSFIDNTLEKTNINGTNYIYQKAKSSSSDGMNKNNEMQVISLTDIREYVKVGDLLTTSNVLKNYDNEKELRKEYKNTYTIQEIIAHTNGTKPHYEVKGK